MDEVKYTVLGTKVDSLTRRCSLLKDEVFDLKQLISQRPEPAPPKKESNTEKLMLATLNLFLVMVILFLGCGVKYAIELLIRSHVGG